MKNKLKKLLVSLPTKVFVGLFAGYLIFSYFVVNPLAKKLVPWVADKQLASQASVGRVAFDPFRLKATVEQFNLADKHGAPLAGFEKLVVDLEFSGLFDWAWRFNEINLLAPQGLVAISPQGKLNWADLIQKLNEDKKPPSETIPRVVIAHIVVKQGQLQYMDAHRAAPYQATLSPLDFELDGFSTLPKDRGDYLIAAKFPEHGGALKWKGDMGVNPVASKGAVAVSGLKLAKILQIVKGVELPFKPSRGDIEANFSYDFALHNDQPKVRLNGLSVGLNQLAGTLSHVGEVTLSKAQFSAPQIDFSYQNQPDLIVQTLDLSLDELSIQRGKETVVQLASTHITLPKLAFVQHNNHPQVQFEDLDVKVSNIQVSHGKGTLLSLPQFDINHIRLDLEKRQANIAQVVLGKGIIQATRNQSGTLNWQSAFEANEVITESTALATDATPANTPVSPFAIEIAEIGLQHWQAALQDQSFKQPLQVNVADINVNFALKNPEGFWTLHRLQTALSNATVKSGTTPKPVASLDKLQLSQGEILLDKQQVNIASLQLSGLKTEIIKPADAPLNWQTILSTNANTAQKVTQVKSKSTKNNDWALNLKKLALENSQLHIEDKSNAVPVVLDVDKLTLEARDATLDLSRAVPIKASFNIKQGGRFEALGKVTPTPLKANLDLKLAALSLKPFSPYLNQFALLKLNEGAGSVAGKLTVVDEKALAVAFNGGFSVDKLALLEEAGDAPFLAWEKLASDSLELSLSPNRVHMAALTITQPAGKFIIHEDKSMNITRVLRSQAQVNLGVPEEQNTAAQTKEPLEAKADTSNIETAKPVEIIGAAVAPKVEEKTLVAAIAPMPTEDTTPAAFPVSIETVRIENAALEFADLSLKPQFGTQIHSLTGVINGVSTNASAIAQVELDGKVDDYGAARIRGSVQPFKATNFTDLKLAFTNLEMNRLTPYSGKFAGRRIDSGKLSVDLEYKIKQRQLSGENKFVINKLKLGEKVDSAEAANLPLDLAIAILEDSDGVIDLDLPITGSLDDPKFSYGSIVWKAIRNVLGKIVTAPFRALGKLFGSGADKLEAITFEAGKAAISPPELEKLKAVSEAFAKRPGLALGVVPSYDALLDARAIQEATLRRQVAEEIGLKLAEGQEAGPIDLTNPKVQKAIDALHDTLTKKGMLKKLAAKFEKPKAGHFEEAQEKLTVSIEVKEADLQALAKARGEVIQKTLLDAGVAAERVRLQKAEVIKADSKTKAINTKLTLDVKSAKKSAEPAVEAPAVEAK